MASLQKKPTQRIIHFTASSHMLSKYVQHYCQTYHNDYYLYCSKNVFYDKCMTKYADQSHMHIVKFDLNDADGIPKNIPFDCLIVSLDLSDGDKDTFLKKYLPLLHKEGHMVILIPKSNCFEHDVWEKLLLRQQLLSFHVIDSLFEHYNVMTAKMLDKFVYGENR